MIMRGAFWRRHSWRVPLFLTIVIGLFGVNDLIRGRDDSAVEVTGLTVDEIRATREPLARLIDLRVRAGGVQLIVTSLLGGAVLLVPFRRGEPWAWYAMWTFPLWSVAAAVLFLFVERQPGATPPPPAISGWVFFGLFAALLWASRGSFRRPDVGTEEHT
jgi:hypothetical protein